MAIGENIKKYRKEAGFTQRELAEKCGVATGTIQQYELEKRQPRIEQLNKIASALNVPTSELINEEFIRERNQLSYNDLTNIENKLFSLGYAINGDESEGYLWIEYPDGILEISQNDLLALDEDIDSYILFKLEELKRKNNKDFKPKKRNDF